MSENNDHRIICIIGIILVFFVCLVLFGADTALFAFMILIAIPLMHWVYQKTLSFIRWCIEVLTLKESQNTDMLVSAETENVPETDVRYAQEKPKAADPVKEKDAIPIKTEQVTKPSLSDEQLQKFAMACSAYTQKRDLALIREELQKSYFEDEPESQTASEKEAALDSRTIENIILDSVTNMPKNRFEQYCVECLRIIGFRSVIRTTEMRCPYADIIAYKDSKKYVVVCIQNTGDETQFIKRAIVGRNEYSANAAIVLSYEYFSEAANGLAEESGIELWDRDKFMLMAIKISFLFKTN